MATNAPRAQGKIMMVGSLPFETVEEGLRAVGSKLGADVTAIPDGEVGPRKMWCMFLASDTYSKHPDLVETRRPSPAIVSNENKPVGTTKTRPGAAPEYHWTFQVKNGVKHLDFGELGYAAAARNSYAIFRRLRDESVIAKGVRFQVSLVATDSGTNVYFDDVANWPMVHQAYVRAMKAEISKMLEVIPADDLLHSAGSSPWEVDQPQYRRRTVFPLAAGKYARSEVRTLHQWTCSTRRGCARKRAASIAFGITVPPSADGRSPKCQISECACRLSNKAVKRIKRHVDYVHMPVVPDPDDAFLAPLQT